MLPSTKEYAIGALLILLVDVLWTGSNYISNTVLTHGYEKPFAMTYLCTASFTLYLIPFFVLIRQGSGREQAESWWSKLGFYLPHMSDAIPTRAGRPSYTAETRRPAIRLRPSSIDGRRPATDLPVSPRRKSVSRLPETQALIGQRDEEVPSQSENSILSHAGALVHASELPPLSIRETAVLSMEFAVIWFVANWSFVAALAYTSVASGTTLGSTSGFFTLVLGSVLGIDRFSLCKFAAVALRYACQLYLLDRC